VCCAHAQLVAYVYQLVDGEVKVDKARGTHHASSAQQRASPRSSAAVARFLTLHSCAVLFASAQIEYVKAEKAAA
jgi:hypothetical protein